MVALRFHRPFSTVSRLVGLWERSDWVHVGIEHEINGYTVVTEATNSNGVVVRLAEMTLQPDAVVPLPWMDNDKATKYLMAFWGCPYGWKDVFGFVTGSNRNFVGVHCAELASLLCAYSLSVSTGVDEKYDSLRSLVLTKCVARISPADLAHALGLTR